MKNKKQTNETQKSIQSKEFSIVGIGASAGGLDALELFFKNIPIDSGLAFVVIQHLDPTQIGIMPELLQRITELKVIRATEKIKVKPNNIYVIPSNKSMTLVNGHLHLFKPIETRGLRLPVDVFFKSLAIEQKHKSIGIILSGMGSDGSEGIKFIKKENGIVAVQEPASAKFDGMPKSAIKAVSVNIIAPADEIPVKLLSYLQYESGIKYGNEPEQIIKTNLEKIIVLLRQHIGHDFSSYKKTTLFRRIERRKTVHNLNSIDDYVIYLQENPKEVEILFKELLIGVTNFFRDTDIWEKLKETILPDYFNQLSDGYIFRIWVPGCSTGEEAYSLAIILLESLKKVNKEQKIVVQIFASDLDNDAIEKARRGIFPKSITNDVSPERIKQFFIAENEGYRVNNSIREIVIFAQHNIIKDPPFTKLDILSCRNMLIYMEPKLQKKLIALFHYSLKPGGILIIGTAETPGSFIDNFKELEQKLKIYERSENNLGSEFIDFPSFFYNNKMVNMTKKNIPEKQENLQDITEKIILQKFAPPTVIINHQGDIIYITGKTGKYIEPAAGKANWNIHAMAREELRYELSEAINKAKLNFEPVNLNNLKIEFDSSVQYINITVQQLENPETVRGMIIIVFNDVPLVFKKEILNSEKSKKKSGARQRELENELQRMYKELQSTREEMQTSQEELKSINEELQSTNEELQSTNEELTTSKEEMQSLNEELQTVNTELQSKVTDYINANNDIKNLLNSTEIATLFLDKELNIRRYTEQMTKIFKLRSADIGRPFTDLVTNLQYPDIEESAKEVLKTLSTIEKATTTNDARWFNVRIMPYRTLDDRIDGLVITFTDITIAKKLELELKMVNDALKKKRNILE